MSEQSATPASSTSSSSSSLSTSPASSNDAFLYDTEQLNAIADEETIRQGLAWFKDNSVHSLSIEGDSLLGMVEDTSLGEELEADTACHLSYSADGNLQVDCQCHTYPEKIGLWLSVSLIVVVE